MLQDEERKAHHVQIRFIWSTMTPVFDYDYDWDPKLRASMWSDSGSLEMAQLLGHPVVDGYESWGFIQGLLDISGHESKNFIFRGPRIHAWSGNPELHRSDSVSIWLENGTMISARKEGCDREGYVVHSDCTLHPMTKCLLPIFQDAHKHVFGSASTNFREYPLEIFTGDVESSHGLNTLKVLSRSWKGWGLSLSGERSDIENMLMMVNDEPENKRLSGRCEKVIALSDTSCENPNAVGGKGSSLAVTFRLQRYSKCLEDFIVPRGMCLTAAAGRDHAISTPAIANAISLLKETRDEKKIQAACDDVVEAFRKSQVLPELQGNIQVILRSIFGRDWEKMSFAVRSSALGEDGEVMSAAGQNETILGVVGKESLMEAILTCWASQFAFRSVTYRRQHGQSVHADMGVVIQEMVAAEAAGVLFTCHPVSGHPGFMSISSNFGIGETVVSASADPDTIMVTRDSDRSFKLDSVEKGEKQKRLVMKDNSLVEEEGAERDLISLSEDDARRLCIIGDFLQSEVGTPQDIEWAIADGDIFILQSRPVTTLHSWSDHELIHEFDTGLFTDHEYTSTGNIAESFPCALSPLAMTFTMISIDSAYQDLILYQPGHFSPTFMKSIVFSHWKGLLNVVNMLFKDPKEEIDPAIRAFQIVIFGRPYEDKEMHSIALERFGAKSSFRRTSEMLRIFSQYLLSSRAMKRAIASYGSFDLPFDPSMTSLELYALMTESSLHIRNVARVHIDMTLITAMFEVIMLSMLAKGNVDFNTESYTDAAELLQCATDVESVKIPKTIRRMSVLAKSKGQEFLKMSVGEAFKYLQKDKGSLGDMFRDFMSRHGHRCKQELDITTPSWHEDPSDIISTMQTIASDPETKAEDKQEDKHRDVGVIVDGLKTELSDKAKWVLRRLIPMCRNAIGRREMARSMFVRSVKVVRNVVLGLANRMVRDGYLPDRDLIFFLTCYEIGELLRKQTPSLIQRAAKRRRIFARLDVLKFPELNRGIPIPENEESPEFLPDDSNAFKLTGTPVCHGIARGTIRVVVLLKDAHEIQRGDILVTCGTDVGWSPYFPVIGGLVTEIGGLLSHGAVVAREYGLPCIIGVKNATKIAKSGTIGILDSGKGTLIMEHS
ncbi:unnamed protein product [Darwinula stevensoni]|uniref:Phosphoenolpyruvate synthase n=1 Tax=Darwinula stevensoni TaxID=69355 RepID=A0A7R9A9Z8_9CRUS|nr:unnamed protein product [Darwinula stevensoni]CAG0897663.1 unnamed protein product [Darwinula stevensoni]